jgi:eukaryotic-like serine/threonine-protein kinase
MDRYAYIGLSVALGGLAQHERAAAAAREAIRLSPDLDGYNNLLNNDLWLDRLEDAKAVFDEAQAHKLDNIMLRTSRYQLAFVENDEASMQEQIAWAIGKPGAAEMLWQRAHTEAYHGRLGAAHSYTLQAVESARSADPSNSGANYEAFEAFRYAELGVTRRAHDEAIAALGKSPNRDVRLTLAMVFARTGDTRKAQELAEAIDREFPLFTWIQNYSLPTIRAAIELDRNNSGRAIEILQRAAPYDLANTDSFDEVMSGIYAGISVSAGRRGTARCC